MGDSILYHDISRHEEFVQSMLEGGSIAHPAIDDLTLRSWRRCRDEFELTPGKAPDPVIIDRVDLQGRLEKYRPLLDIARMEMTNLYQQLAGSGHAIMLTDRDGVLMNYVGDPQLSMHQGAVWSEAVQSTNGMGTCLEEKKPLVIHKGAHFLDRNAKLTCAAAPIFDPHGEILAVLDASSESTLAQQHTMVLLNMSAQVIENRAFFCAMKDAFILRFHARPEFISTLGEGAIAFDPEGKILAAIRHSLPLPTSLTPGSGASCWTPPKNREDTFSVILTWPDLTALSEMSDRWDCSAAWPALYVSRIFPNSCQWPLIISDSVVRCAKTGREPGA